METDKTKKSWSEYYEITKNRPPSKLLVRALEYVKEKHKAIDIGGGALKDTRYLLEQGFEVMVIDKDQLMAEAAKSIASDKLHYAISSFDTYDFPKNTFDIANASYALPFNPPETFNDTIERIKKSLVQEGIFCGQLFGVKDGWTNRKEMTFHTKEQAEVLFSDMEIISFEEEERDGTTANGTAKYWHVLNIVARKT